MNSVKNILLIVVLLCIGFSIAGCTRKTDDADAKMQKQTAESMKEANAQIGMPAIVNFQEKKLLKMIYELRDQEKFICYAYLFNPFKGELVFIGKCYGYGLPYCVQYSNPERVVSIDHVAGVDMAGYGPFDKMPQPEPNGLFMPQTLSATWLIMIDPKTGDGRVVYIEPEIIVSPFPLHKT